MGYRERKRSIPYLLPYPLRVQGEALTNSERYGLESYSQSDDFKRQLSLLRQKNARIRRASRSLRRANPAKRKRTSKRPKAIVENSSSDPTVG